MKESDLSHENFDPETLEIIENPSIPGPTAIPIASLRIGKAITKGLPIS